MKKFRDVKATGFWGGFLAPKTTGPDGRKNKLLL